MDRSEIHRMKMNRITCAILLAAGLSTWPIFASPTPPIMDLPSTAGRIWLELRVWEGRVFEAEQFRFVLPPPYALHDLLVALAAKLTGQSPTRVILAVDLVAWVALLAALVRIGRMLRMAAPLWLIPLVASLLRWDFAGQFGNFAWRMGETLLLIFYARLIMAPDRPRPLWLWLAPVCLYFTHVIAFAFWALMLAVDSVSRKSARWPALAACVVPLAYHLIRLTQVLPEPNPLADDLGPSGASSYHWIPWSWSKLALIGGVYTIPALQWSLFLTLAFILAHIAWRAVQMKPPPAAAGADAQIERRHFAQVLAFLAAAVLLPYITEWPGPAKTVYLHYANARALELALLMALVYSGVLLPADSTIRLRILMPALIVTALAVQGASLTKYVRWNQGLQRMVFGDWPSALRPGRRFYSVVFPSLSGYPGLHRFPHYAAEFGSYDPRLFIEEHFWIRPNSPWPVPNLFETRLAPYQRREFLDFYDDVLIATTPQDPFVQEYVVFWKQAHPAGTVMELTPFVRLFRKN
ncbi:MAG: hypothetical protein A3G34_08340 [Candidatus Lindowbacteria bacterium RIFCSPLOWO2_12_FULL_62_27]|nr:MAG: hypothetical protein A3G34_08340 [Candidatus Lindowbacteria bacterium RIFCSPLOWO2_12_FULL_62_27]